MIALFLEPRRGVAAGACHRLLESIDALDEKRVGALAMRRDARGDVFAVLPDALLDSGEALRQSGRDLRALFANAR